MLDYVAVLGFFIDGPGQFGIEAYHLFAKPLFDDVFQAYEGSPAYKQYLSGVDLYIRLLGVFPSALRRDVGSGSFEHLQKRLLDAFAGDIAGNRDIFDCFADFVDFVDIDDASLGGFYVVVSGLQQSQ